MSHARAVVAGVLSAGLVVLIVTQDADEDLVRAGLLLSSVVVLLMMPDAWDYLKRRQDKED